MPRLTATFSAPCSYTTDFDEMERLVTEPGMNKEELVACLEEFRRDYNKTHFVRNQTFQVRRASCCISTLRIFPAIPQSSNR